MKALLPLWMLGWVAALTLVQAEPTPTSTLIKREWTIAGVPREALIHSPSGPSDQPVALVFVFHGHGGTMQRISTSIPVHQLWPEALVIYPQGLPTVGALTDPEGVRAGWQKKKGDYGDRDLKFFDAMLGSLRHDYKIDDRRIYVTGHSNGGGFTYLLWAVRPDVFAAFGPSAALAQRGGPPLRPLPVIHIACQGDELVKFAWQQTNIAFLRRNNQCGEGHPAGKGCTVYESKIGAPVMTFIAPGGHHVPAEAPALIVDFFKAHPKSSKPS